CWALAFAAFAAITSSPRRAQARACSVASDCPKGFDCAPGAVAAGGGPAGGGVSRACQSEAGCAARVCCSLGTGTVCHAAEDGGETCESSSACVPQWDAPCVTDADCGPGFTCPPSMGGSFNCGKDQDASQPPYATVAVVPCSDVPVPPVLLADAG